MGQPEAFAKQRNNNCLFLVLVADDFEDGYFGVVADAITRADDARVAAGAVAELGRDLAEKVLRDGRPKM